MFQEIWCVTVTTELSGEIVRREFLPSELEAEIRRTQLASLPPPAGDSWRVEISAPNDSAQAANSG